MELYHLSSVHFPLEEVLSCEKKEKEEAVMVQPPPQPHQQPLPRRSAVAEQAAERLDEHHPLNLCEV